MGGFHLCWSFLVLLGGAQPLMDFIFWAHMIRPVYFIQRFDLAAAATLVVLTTGFGYLSGLVGGALWNRIHQ